MAKHKPIPSLSVEDQASFWSFVDRGKSSECWLWKGRTDAKGYGLFKNYRAHRVAFTIASGPFRDELTLDHLCRTPPCVNPDHLELVTNQENILRGIGPTAINARKTHCMHGHLFTSENTIPRDGWRRCRLCAKRAARMHVRHTRSPRMYQSWFCDTCKTKGVTRMVKHIGAWEAIEKIVAAHVKQTPACVGQVQVRSSRRLRDIDQSIVVEL